MKKKGLHVDDDAVRLATGEVLTAQFPRHVVALKDPNSQSMFGLANKNKS